MPEKSRGNSRGKQAQKRTHRPAVNDLAPRDAKAKGVKGGRDAASGLATGKRQHKPIR